MLYVNGDSYMIQSTGKNTGDWLSENLNMPVINKSITGSSNDRIFRTSLRDLLNLKKDHKNITAIVGLSFIYRKSIWDPIGQLEKWKNQDDGEFASYQMFTELDWVSRLRLNKKFNKVPPHILNYSKEWARLFDPEAEMTILLQEIELFSTWCESHDIKYCIFSSPRQEDIIDLNAPFIKPFNDALSTKRNVLNIFEFSFLKFSEDNGFIGFDYDRHGKYAHQGEAAHKKFAEFLLDNYLK